MKKKNWFKPKAFTHLTEKLTQNDGKWIKNYVSDATQIEKHKFFPLIHRTIVTKRFKNGVNINENTIKKHHTFKGGKRISNVKYREIYYPNHLDAHIYSYYTQKLLEPKYEAELKACPVLDNSVLAYRRIPLPDDSRGKCNIDFANEVFDEISKTKGEVAVIALDISKFFDSLDHKMLKQAWAGLLGRKDLEKDHYNIYKSLTQFSFVEMNSMLKEFGYKHPNELIQEQVSCFIESGKEFREKIKDKGYIKRNPFRRVDKDKSGNPNKKVIGIPQGTPMSAFLANLYLLKFDKAVISLLDDCSGIYRRYSDDILIICPKGVSKEKEDKLYDFIKDYKLLIQPTKTQKSFFVNGRLEKGQKPVVYLGFMYDGHNKVLKSASLAKLYRKMKTSVRFRAYRAFLAKKKRAKGGPIDATLHRKKLYQQFSYLGSSKANKKNRNFFSYASFAARIMNSPQINNQLSNAWSVLHSEIKKQEKNYRLPKLKPKK